jgi:hypothetical protein
MGGHGTWINGAMFPGKWAAIAPSAGWSTFWSYAGAWDPKDATPVELMFRRAMNVSDTLMYGDNLAASPVYILHGDKDDNVPVEQARNMRKFMESMGLEPAGYHEEPGAGHWWDKDGPGAECVDWPPLMTLFNDARILPHPIALQFTTVNPAVSATNHWVTIEQQERSLLPSTVKFAAPDRNVLRGTTSNVRRIRINDPAPQLWGLKLELDGQPVEFPTTLHNPVHLIKSAGKWVATKPADPAEKSPNRSGPFKTAFANNVVLVYGTAGTAEENAWAYNKARYDAETFYYRGNGSFEIVADKAFRGRKEQNVVLYGNSDTNSAWSALLADSPVQVSRGLVRVGTRPLPGPNLAACFVRPRKGTKTALVGVVSGTGLPGMNLTTRLPFFLSGAAFPDWFVLDTGYLSDGSRAARAAGFFDNNWNLTDEDSAWR